MYSCYFKTLYFYPWRWTFGTLSARENTNNKLKVYWTVCVVQCTELCASYSVLNCVRCTVYWPVCVVQCTELCASYCVLNCVRRTVYRTVCVVQCTEMWALYRVRNCVRRIVYWTVCVVHCTELCASYCVLNCVRRTVYRTVCVVQCRVTWGKTAPGGNTAPRLICQTSEHKLTLNSGTWCCYLANTLTDRKAERYLK